MPTEDERAASAREAIRRLVTEHGEFLPATLAEKLDETQIQLTEKAFPYFEVPVVVRGVRAQSTDDAEEQVAVAISEGLDCEIDFSGGRASKEDPPCSGPQVAHEAHGRCPGLAYDRT